MAAVAAVVAFALPPSLPDPQVGPAPAAVVVAVLQRIDVGSRWCRGKYGRATAKKAKQTASARGCAQGPQVDINDKVRQERAT